MSGTLLEVRSTAQSTLRYPACCVGVSRDVCACPDRAFHVVKYFGGHRAEQESPKRAVAMRRHHYKIDVVPLSVLNDQPRRIPLAHEARCRNILKFTFQ